MMPLIVVGGALGAFYSTVFGDDAVATALGLLNSNESATKSPASVANDALVGVIFAGFIFIIHLLYLYRVADDQVMRKPAHDVHLIELILPSLLAATYFATAVIEGVWPGLAFESFAGKALVSKVVSIFLFFFIYVVWAIHDYIELSQHKASLSTSERSRKQAWLSIDIALAVLLLVPLIEYLTHSNSGLLSIKAFGHFGLKDVAAGATVAARLLLEQQARQARAGLYPVLHADWQESLRADASHRGTGPRIAPGRATGPLRILFVNADSGSRMQQVTEFFSLETEDREVSIYNARGVSEAADDDDIDEYTTDKNRAIVLAKQADLIVVVNSLYFEDEVMEARELIHSARPGALVAIRGFADHSFIATIAYQLAMNPRHDKNIHLWNSKNIDRLFAGYPANVHVLEEALGIEEPGLFGSVLSEPLAEGNVRQKRLHHSATHRDVPYPPLGVIKQSLVNTSRFRFVLANYLVQPLSEASADAVREQMEALAHVDAERQRYRDVLNVDDYVYLFRLGSEDQTDAPRVFSDARSERESELSAAARNTATS